MSILHDYWQLARVYTFQKAINWCLVYISFKVNKVWGMPYAFSIEPTTSCNLRCPECPSGLRSFTRETGHLELEKLKLYIDQYAKNALYLTFYFQGEPYLNPHFLEMVRYAKNKKIYVSTSTNAHYLNLEKAKETVKSGLDRLIISIDGTTQDTYEQYRIGGNLQKVKEGLANIANAKKELNSKTPYIIVQFLVVKPNEHQIEEVKTLGLAYGANEVKLKTAQLYDYKNGNPLMPTIEKYSRYIQKADGTYKLKHELKDECWRMWHSNVVTWDGKIVPCCFDKDAKYVMGDLNTNPLKSIWQNDRYKKFRKQLQNNRNAIDICQNCTEGAKVYE